jgi:Lrp/AsnC family leucine-responsive transcriptional regulator
MADALDTIDLAILEHLLKDARTPASQIAEQVGLSRPAVAERIDKLTEAGVIRGTTCVVAHEMLGKSVTAFVAARRPGVLSAAEKRAFRSILEREDVLEAHSVAGDDCYLLKVRTDSIQGLNGIVNALNSPPLSMATRTTIVMATHCEKVGGIAAWGSLDEK